MFNLAVIEVFKAASQEGRAKSCEEAGSRWMLMLGSTEHAAVDSSDFPV